jgi:hypothetical protein
MEKPETPADSEDSATAAERRLRGSALEGAESKRAADHATYEKRRNPDTELRLDGEEDTLYDDGLDTGDDDPEPLAGTRGQALSRLLRCTETLALRGGCSVVDGAGPRARGA